jgi:methylthioribose-1-phosphate isomerase
MLRPIEWRDNKIFILDQKLLPFKEYYIECNNYKDVTDAIKNMNLRGAPLIGVAAAMGIALGALNIKADNFDDFYKEFEDICDNFAYTRPTAINLFWAIDRMKKLCRRKRCLSIGNIKDILLKEAIKIFEDDININKKIGMYGGALIKNGCRILTHCNAGALATAGYGTALGVVRKAHEDNKSIRVYVDETRPFLQGARLTAWELIKENIDAVLITDSMAGFLMKRGMIDVVIVGADRIAANGDVANKIGTYALGVLAKSHNIPFYVAAPISTLDLNCNSGEEIPIEERNVDEVRHICGVKIAPDEVKIFNPAFDITPNKFITGIITEKGVITRPFFRKLRKLVSK